ncbi:MAG: hypothetical protein LBT81_00320 [Helicobacteraceae bacterium]|jgi:hypothetical protein|nr:hypothetical protein [Helicobacteraceae bacterium]
MDFNPLLSSIGVLWRKPLNYAETVRVNKGAEETSRPNSTATKEKTKILASERNQTYTAKVNTRATEEIKNFAPVVQQNETYTHTKLVNSYEQAKDDFGFSERAAHTFAAVRNDIYAERYGIAEEDRISVEVAKVFAETTDAFFTEFVDGQNLPEATMSGLRALNLLLPVYFANDSSFGIPTESYYGNLKGANKPARVTKDSYQPSGDILNKVKDTPFILLRCIFETKERFDLVVTSSVITETEKYCLIINSDQGTYQIDLDFYILWRREDPMSYFLIKDPFSIGGISVFDYSVQSNDAIQKAMLEPPPLTLSIIRLNNIVKE